MSIYSFASSCSSVAFCFLGTPVLTAQGGPDPCLTAEPSNSIEWPAYVAPNDPVEYRRIVVAELDGNAAPDGVAIEDGEALVFWNLAVHDAPQEIDFPSEPSPSGVMDVAPLPGGGTDGRDAVLMTDGRGLFRVSYGADAFADPDTIATGLWEDAWPLVTVDLDLDGDLDVVSIAADRRTVLTLTDEGAEFEPGLAYTEPLDVRDVTAVDWNHDGTRELVVLSTRGILVHDHQTGALVATTLHVSQTGCVTRLQGCDFPGGEVLAWTRGTGSGVSQLVLLGEQYSDGPWWLDILVCEDQMNVHPTAIAAGDHDDDGKDDLLLVHARQSAIVLENQGASPHFAPSSASAYDVVQLSAEPGTIANVGIPAFVQIDEEIPDENCPMDIVVPVSTTARVLVFMNLGFESTSQAQSSAYDSADIAHPDTEFGSHDTAAGAELRFAFHVPLRYRSYDYIDLVLWEQLGPVTATAVDPDGISFRRHDLATVTDEGQVVAAPYQWVHVDHAFVDAVCWTPEKPCYYTEYRFVKATAAGEVFSPIFTGGFTLEPCNENDPDFYQYLIEQGIPGTAFELYEDNDLDPEGSMPRHMVGLYVPMSAQPPFPDNSHPDPGDRLNGLAATIFTPQE